MALLVWSEAYGVGNAMLDADHRILISLVNQLHDATETGQSRAVVGTVISVLAEYTEHHFRREEAMLTATGFPSLERHMAEHRNLEARVCDIRDRWAGGERQALGQEVLEFLKKWLTDHILGADKSYGPWVGNVSGQEETAAVGETAGTRDASGVFEGERDLTANGAEDQTGKVRFPS